MTVCGKCGKPVKYIAGRYGKVYACNAERQELVTDNGHIAHGYSIHICNNTENIDSNESAINEKPN